MTLAVKASIQCFQPVLYQPQSKTLISLSISLSLSLSHFVTQWASRRPEFLFSFFFLYLLVVSSRHPGKLLLAVPGLSAAVWRTDE